MFRLILNAATLLAVAWFLLSYIKGQSAVEKPVARYQDNPQETLFDEDYKKQRNTDGCERYINADRIQDCLDSVIREKRSQQ
ncbi:MAG: hypothetical protein KTR32_39500 [Granulosicoccus sp.]|nr:hypothetical protein [Granulosicoccus sp.]